MNIVERLKDPSCEVSREECLAEILRLMDALNEVRAVAFDAVMGQGSDA